MQAPRSRPRPVEHQFGQCGRLANVLPFGFDGTGTLLVLSQGFTLLDSTPLASRGTPELPTPGSEVDHRQVVTHSRYFKVSS